LLDGRAILVTTDGLYASEDAGRTWTPLKGTSRDKIGEAAAIHFKPDAPDTYYLATSDKGIWATDDGGKSFRQIGTESNGLAANETVDVRVFLGDRQFKTLLAAHGDASPGLSRSTDGGKTWEVLQRGYSVHLIEPGMPYGDYRNLFLVASPTDRPEIRNVYHCAAMGDHWQAVAGDLIVTDLAGPSLDEGWSDWRGRHVYFATADAGVYGISKTEVARLGPEEHSRCSSVATTWARTADTELMVLYETGRLGMVVSTDGLKTWRNFIGPLPVGPFVRQGAHIRPNASGTAFYAVANGRLYRGRVYTGPHTIEDLAVKPPVLHLMSDRLQEAELELQEKLQQFRRRRQAAPHAQELLADLQAFADVADGGRVTITARVTGETPPAGVTIDTSRLGGSGETPMFDDGEHADGRKGDGVYGAFVLIDPRAARTAQGDWRHPRGRVGLTVTAVSAKGELSGAVAALGLYDVPTGFRLFGRDNERKIGVEGESWRVEFGGGREGHDITGQTAIVFDLRVSPGGAGKDVRVRLRDAPPFSMPTETPGIALVRDGYVPGGAVPGEYVRVVVPLRRLLEPAEGFVPTHFSRVVFSGEGGFRGAYWVRDLRFEADPAALDSGKGRTGP
jgi:hypothetical protein